MKHITKIQPISYLKANAAQVLRDLAIDLRSLVITQSGEAVAVLQDVSSFEKNLDTMALLKILTLGNSQVKNGQLTSAAKAFAQIRRGDMAAT